jgi:SAM-dependent methyltransferase
MDLANSKMLHIAPEPFFRRLFSSMGIGQYETGDLAMKGVDHVIDLCSLPFAEGSYDIVYASHVLEHIRDDQRALAEIHRILSPGGIAILPVPIVVDHTVEYDAANPLEEHHVRAPGLDYFDRYREVFEAVTVIGSADYPEEYQLFIFEDRSVYPTNVCPQRTPMTGERHSDFVPVCRKLVD